MTDKNSIEPYFTSTDDNFHALTTLQVSASDELKGITRANLIYPHVIDVYKIDRKSKSVAKTFSELSQGGIYFLVRQYHDGLAVYVGQASKNVVNRALFQKHEPKRMNDIDSFWEYALIVVRHDIPFTEHEIDALEHHFIGAAMESIAESKNSASGKDVRLSDVDKMRLHGYIGEINRVLEYGFNCGWLITKADEKSNLARGANDAAASANMGALNSEKRGDDDARVLRQADERKMRGERNLQNITSGTIFHFAHRQGKWDAKMRVKNGKCVVLSGSVLAPLKEYVGVNGEVVLRARSDAKISTETLDGTERLVLREDYEFASPSAAGGFVNGGTANGWEKWRDEHGKKLDEYARK